MANTDMWSGLEKTDPAYTKRFTRGGGFSGTAINGTYIVRRLTEAFGPCGKGWRFVIEDERIEDGHLLKSGDRARVHIIRGHLSYLLDGAWYETSPQFGQTMLVDENRHGAFTDEEAPKKSITDCIAKCAVLLGIGADIHLGLFDDNKYVNARKEEEAAKKAAAEGDAPAEATAAKPKTGAPVKKEDAKEDPPHVKDAKAIVHSLGTIKDPDELRGFIENLDARLLAIKDVSTATYNHVVGEIQKVETALKVAA